MAVFHKYIKGFSELPSEDPIITKIFFPTNNNESLSVKTYSLIGEEKEDLGNILTTQPAMQTINLLQVNNLHIYGEGIDTTHPEGEKEIPTVTESIVFTGNQINFQSNKITIKQDTTFTIPESTKIVFDGEINTDVIETSGITNFYQDINGVAACVISELYIKGEI